MAGCYSSRHVSQSDNYNYSDQDNTEVNYETFYSQLQPYGNWTNSVEYGNVWQPYASEGFRPYETGGHWVSTVDGWAWASDYNWGWAPFHYGRWLLDPSIGWAWVPGYEWAPAWVTWGQYNDYYAWAPLAPGINVGYENAWRAPGNYWSFVPRNYINYPNLNRYTVRNYNTNVNNITIINNYNSYNQRDYYHRGPDYHEVEQFTHRVITPVGIASTQKPGPSRVVRKELEIYRPSGSAANGSPLRPKSLNETRRYNGSVRADAQTEGNINQPNTIRNHENINLKNTSPKEEGGVLSNGIKNGDNFKVTQESIEKANRRLEQQQIENFRNNRRQASQNNLPDLPGNADKIHQYPSNDQQNKVRQPVLRNNSTENVQPARPRPDIQNDRIMQRPALPQQSEKLMRAQQGSSMPARIERREPAPVRSPQIERPVRTQQRPF